MPSPRRCRGRRIRARQGQPSFRHREAQARPRSMLACAFDPDPGWPEHSKGWLAIARSHHYVPSRAHALTEAGHGSTLSARVDRGQTGCARQRCSAASILVVRAALRCRQIPETIDRLPPPAPPRARVLTAVRPRGKAAPASPPSRDPPLDPIGAARLESDREHTGRSVRRPASRSGIEQLGILWSRSSTRRLAYRSCSMRTRR